MPFTDVNESKDTFCCDWTTLIAAVEETGRMNAKESIWGIGGRLNWNRRLIVEQLAASLLIQVQDTQPSTNRLENSRAICRMMPEGIFCLLVSMIAWIIDAIHVELHENLRHDSCGLDLIE